MIALRSDHITAKSAPSSDVAPDFSPLISDTEMQLIINNRWIECTLCINASAPLAATVMMGGLLEAILLARINRETDKTAIFTSRSAPKDKTNKVKVLKEWTLNDYIQVVHELSWVTVSAKDISTILREYRNYIHPHKQHSNGVHLHDDDALLFWEITKGMHYRQKADNALLLTKHGR